jgi:hypothetical protein
MISTLTCSCKVAKQSAVRFGDGRCLHGHFRDAASGSPVAIWAACPDALRDPPAQVRPETARRWTVLAVFGMTDIYRQDLRALPSLIGWENLGAERGDHGRYSPTN